VYGTFIEDQAGIRLLDIIGEDNVMLECDYPHSDSTWPDTPAMANKWLGHLSDEVQHKITIGNASRVYDFTPADPATITL
jgi:predicted TIM-barrel fold metal-dependent hydrolase